MINIIKQEIPIDESLKNFYILTILIIEKILKNSIIYS